MRYYLVVLEQSNDTLLLFVNVVDCEYMSNYTRCFIAMSRWIKMRQVHDNPLQPFHTAFTMQSAHIVPRTIYLSTHWSRLGVIFRNRVVDVDSNAWIQASIDTRNSDQRARVSLSSSDNPNLSA